MMKTNNFHQKKVRFNKDLSYSVRRTGFKVALCKQYHRLTVKQRERIVLLYHCSDMHVKIMIKIFNNSGPIVIWKF